ncbi:NAD(P)-binding protein [Trichoderma longibrachiatum]
MSPRSDNAIVIIGSGPGIATITAAVFAANKFNKVALVARNPSQLDKDAESVKSAANNIYNTITVKTYSTDSRHLEVTNDELIRDFKISTVALNNVTKWAMPQLVALAEKDASAKPTLIVTSSHLPEAPETDLVSLSVAKAAQKNFVRSLRMEFEPKGVHVALSSVAGYVFDHN